MPDYAVRLTYAYDDIASLIGAWALRVEQLAVYEHVGEATKKVHCHLVMTGSNVDKKQLRNIAMKYRDVKGNELCSFKQFDGSDIYMSYMTKGKHEPKYLKGYTIDDHERWIKAWRPPSVSQQKVDKNTKMYQEFCVSQGYEMLDNNILSIKRAGKYYVRNVLNMCFSVNACNIYKMLVRTYCYDNDITIPAGDKLDW